MAIDENHEYVAIYQSNKEQIMIYEEQTNAELSSMIEDLGIDVDAKNPKKPNKAELVAALYKYDGVEPAEVVSNDTEVKAVVKPKKQTLAQKKREQHKKYMKLIRVNITSNSVSQTKNLPNQVMTISWGNRLLGYQTDRLILGKPWHIRYGALKNLEDSVISVSVQNDEKNRIETIQGPAYNIAILPMLDKPALDKLAKKQTIRNESIAALIDE